MGERIQPPQAQQVWHRPGSSEILTLGDLEHLADIVDARYSRATEVDRTRPERSGRFWAPGHLLQTRRSASLIRFFSAAPRFLRNCSSIAATSSSIVSVVRMNEDIGSLIF